MVRSSDPSLVEAIGGFKLEKLVLAAIKENVVKGTGIEAGTQLES